MPQDKCVYKCTPLEGHPPIYVGLFAYDLVYYYKSDKVEQWFENSLKSHISVNFMGDVSLFLGQRYDWHTDIDGTVSCHISQQAFIEGMLDKFNMKQCKKARSPYCSGLIIDRIERDNIDPTQKPKLVHDFQLIIGCLN